MTKLPGYHVGLGFAFFALGFMAKDNLSQAIGSLPVIQLPCAFFSAVLIPFGALLALHAIIFQKGPPRVLLNYHMLALIFVPVILSWYFATSILMTHVLDLAQPPSILPKLIENARSFPDEQKREAQAKWAYRLYGATIAYRLDGEQVEFYQPSPDDTSAWKAAERSGRQAQIQTAFIKKVTNQFTYLFALYAGTFTATFVAGWVWLLIKLRKHRTWALANTYSHRGLAFPATEFVTTVTENATEKWLQN